MKEAKTVLRTKAIIDGVEQEVLIMPITRLDCIEDSADVLEVATDEDYIPVMDSKDNGQMKKISVEKLIPKVENKADKSHTHTASEVSGLPTSLPANGGNAATVNDHSVNSDVPSNAKFTDTTYGNASSSAAGLVSTGAQTFAGNKSFNGQVLPNGASACGTAQARKLSSGTAEPNSTTCPAGAWYGQYE